MVNAKRMQGYKKCKETETLVDRNFMYFVLYYYYYYLFKLQMGFYPVAVVLQ
jgi:hypothetical protein